jgi:hypothetical protein
VSIPATDEVEFGSAEELNVPVRKPMKCLVDIGEDDAFEQLGTHRADCSMPKAMGVQQRSQDKGGDGIGGGQDVQPFRSLNAN